MAPITHIVLLRFPDNLQSEIIRDLSLSFIRLKEECKLADGSTYILSVKGGKQNSPEGKGKGLQYGFVVEFASEKDREWYLQTDPIHLAFASRVGQHAEDVCIVDFSDGVL